MPADRLTPSVVSAAMMRQRVGRRGVVAGAAGLVVAAAGAALGANRLRSGGENPAPASAAQTAPTPTAGPPPPISSPARVANARSARQVVAQLPAGMALVTSPRLPLFGVGPEDVAKLLGAQVPDWREVGSPIGLPVEPVALDGQVPPGMTPKASFPKYDTLAADLAKRFGGVALVPVDQVDFRVNVLSVGGFDPLREATGGEPVVRLGVVGDIVPGRNVDNMMRKYGDYRHPFLKIAAELSSYDLCFANLEGNLSNTIQPPTNPHTFTFVSSPQMLDGFKLAGIDGVSLANNHSTWNSEGWGPRGLLDTMDALSGAGLPFFGAGHTIDEARAPWVSTIKGKSVAIVGIDGVTANETQRPGTVEGSWAGASDYAGAGANQPGTNPFTTDQFLGDLKALAGQHDVVIPYFHFGVEYVANAPDWAVVAARAAIDAGATMVVTNHPHVIQGMEIHAGKPIVYSVGNFIFDQMFSAEVREGMILEIDLRGNKVVGLRLRGVEIEDFNQPRLMSAGEQASLMDRFWDATDRLAVR